MPTTSVSRSPLWTHGPGNSAFPSAAGGPRTEKQRLRERLEEDHSYQQIAAQLRRSVTAVRVPACRLGLAVRADDPIGVALGIVDDDGDPSETWREVMALFGRMAVRVYHQTHAEVRTCVGVLTPQSNFDRLGLDLHRFRHESASGDPGATPWRTGSLPCPVGTRCVLLLCETPEVRSGVRPFSRVPSVLTKSQST